MGKKNLVYGVGINDANYRINYMQDGVYVRCPYYTVWKSMLMRCYCDSYLSKNPSYAGCTVCKEWLTFSNFKSWMEKQDWKDKQLDKDLMLQNSKLYSADTCLFVDRYINNFLEMKKSKKSNYMLGVTYDKSRKKYSGMVRNALGKDIHLERYITEFGAHLNYLKNKIIVGELYLKQIKDPVVKKYFNKFIDRMRFCLNNRMEFKY